MTIITMNNGNTIKVHEEKNEVLGYVTNGNGWIVLIDDLKETIIIQTSQISHFK
jgi:hypothetical protein